MLTSTLFLHPPGKNLTFNVPLFTLINKRFNSKKTTKNPYDTLGVTRASNQKDIKEAYYRLSKQYHPDVNQSEEAAVRFQDITNAYEQIGSEDSRSKYDRDTQARVTSGKGMRRPVNMMKATRGPEARSFEPSEELLELFRQRRKKEMATKASYFTSKKSALESWQAEQEKRRKFNEEKSSDSFDQSTDETVEKSKDKVKSSGSENKFASPKSDYLHYDVNPANEPPTVQGGIGLVMFALFILVVAAHFLAPDIQHKPKNFEAFLKKISYDEPAKVSE